MLGNARIIIQIMPSGLSVSLDGAGNAVTTLVVNALSVNYQRWMTNAQEKVGSLPARTY